MTSTEPRRREPELWPAYLAYFREQVIEGVLALTEEQRRTSCVPSRWTPIELLSHCLHMEQRWFVWRFLGEAVEDLWGDWNRADPWTADDSDRTRPGARWQVAEDVTAEMLAERLRAVGERTTAILQAHDPAQLAAEGSASRGIRPPWSGSASTCSRNMRATLATSTSRSSSSPRTDRGGVGPHDRRDGPPGEPGGSPSRMTAPVGGAINVGVS